MLLSDIINFNKKMDNLVKVTVDNSVQVITNSAVELGDDIDTETNGKGRKFTSRFIEAGIAHYNELGNILITKETLDKFLNTMVGCPVVILHKTITDNNADKERVGVISDVWYNNKDGWFYCSGIIWDKKAIDLIKNQGWNVSCTYEYTSDFTPRDYNGGQIDMEFTDGKFLYLALVDNPRYTGANIVINSKDNVNNADKWITIKPNGEENKGKHLLLKDGETPSEAIERIYKKDKTDKENNKVEEENKKNVEKTELEQKEETYNDILKRYKDNENKRWDSYISLEDYNKYTKEAESAKKELTIARRNYAEAIMADFKPSDVNEFEDKQNAKRERYQQLSDKANRESERAEQIFHNRVKDIPLGQPIIIGHHSEKRATKYSERSLNIFAKSMKLKDKANYYANKANSVGKAGISSRDTNAIAKLAEKYNSKNITSAEKRRIIDRVIELYQNSNYKNNVDNIHFKKDDIQEWITLENGSKIPILKGMSKLEGIKHFAKEKAHENKIANKKKNEAYYIISEAIKKPVDYVKKFYNTNKVQDLIEKAKTDDTLSITTLNQELEHFNAKELEDADTNTQEKIIDYALDVIEGNTSEYSEDEYLSKYNDEGAAVEKAIEKSKGDIEKAEKELQKALKVESLENLDINLLMYFYEKLNDYQEINNTVNNSNRKDNLIMAVMDELKEFIVKVVNNECDKKVKNEDVDKRELLREADAIAMKPASEFKGGEEEKFRTLTKKLEELGYNKSLAGTSDNEDEEDKEEDKKDKEEMKKAENSKKCKNEDEEDKEEYEKAKEIADNKKVDNANDIANKITEAIMGGTSEFKTVPEYVSRDERLKLGDNY